jgi:hypothetical protein
VIVWPPCFHEALESSVPDNVQRPQAFADPTDNLGPDKSNIRHLFPSPEPRTYLVSALVCCLFEYVTFPFPFRSNDAVILPVSKMDLTTLSLATCTSRALSAALIASLPQQLFACLRKFPDEFASPLSKNRRHLYLQDLPTHEKTWQRRPSTYSISGVGL